MQLNAPTIAAAQASFIAFTGFVCFAAPVTFLKLYGLTPIAQTRPARVIAPAFGARNLGFALTIIAFYQKQDYKSMATTMLGLTVAGLMDAFVTFREKQYGGAAFHAGGSALLVFLASKMW